MSDFKDIWTPDGGGKLSDEQLIAYLERRLSEDEQHDLEALMSGEGMESDALEGLQDLSADEAIAMKRKLNLGLQATLKKKRPRRRGLADGRWTLFAIVLLLILAAVCFGAVWLMKRPH